MDFFQLLPNELLINIFEYMTTKELILKIQLINKNWNNISKDNYLWKFFCKKKYNKIIEYENSYRKINHLYKWMSKIHIDIHHRRKSLLIYDTEILNDFKKEDINFFILYKKLTDFVTIEIDYHTARQNIFVKFYFMIYVKIPRQFKCNEFCEQLQNYFGEKNKKEIIEFCFEKDKKTKFESKSTEIINFCEKDEIILNFYDHEFAKRCKAYNKKY